ncbi:AraC family transcriptional regulator [Streptomyces sp. NRRL S-340]|uniref:AraC family transcriptional regulator n=1 Tax=Streptomyces sp. NRRL S-340 TaxID=1463901 RepID=UPI00068A8496|nr:AraC family transcriptional regulator [Streptomyces sp. NRRL S-340]
MDPLEDVLALLDTRGRISVSLAAGGNWAVRFAPPADVKFNAVRRGSCRLEVDGVPEPVLLAEGDCYLLTRERAFTLSSGPDVAPVAAKPVFARAENGVARTGSGDDVLLLGSRFTFNSRARALLLDSLPPVIHIPAGTSQAETLHWALSAIDRELRNRALGATLVSEHLAVVMLVHVLRLHLAREPHIRTGWLAGLGDPAVATALACVHRDPARPWTVSELARAASVSRSTLAERFKRYVGRAPQEYLTEWRIELAAKRLLQGGETVSAAARAVGYGSESALSAAFKRVTGMSPRDYRRQAGRRCAAGPPSGRATAVDSAASALMD